MSVDDEYNELEIETVAAVISAERAGQCEEKNYDFDEREGDCYDHPSSFRRMRAPDCFIRRHGGSCSTDYIQLLITHNGRMKKDFSSIYSIKSLKKYGAKFLVILAAGNG